MPGRRLTTSGVLKLILTVSLLVAIGVIVLPILVFQGDIRHHKIETERHAQKASQSMDALKPLNAERRQCGSEIEALQERLAELSGADGGIALVNQGESAKIQSNIARLTTKRQQLNDDIRVVGNELKKALMSTHSHHAYVNHAEPPRVNPIYVFISFAVFLTAWQIINTLVSGSSEGHAEEMKPA